MPFIGLTPRVRYRIELGFAFVDDGERMFKLDGAVLQRLNDDPRIGDDEALRRLLADLPSVFIELATEAEARATFIDAEI